MKKAIVLAFILAAAVSALAQTMQVSAKPLTDNDIQLMKQDVQAIKDDVIKHTMAFTATESDAFWPVYRRYSTDQRAIADKRLALITEYAQKLEKLDNATASSMTKRLFQVEDETQRLREKYYPEFEKAIGAKRAAKFYQVDNRLSLMVNLQLASEVPLIP